MTATNSNFMKQMRTIHRYLGFFLMGIILMYITSGVIMTFRDTDFLKHEEAIEKTLEPGITADNLGKALDQRRLKVKSENDKMIYFENGQYNKQTGVANYTEKEWPAFVNKITDLHKSRSGEPTFILNLIFAGSLLFFVISSFWMYPTHSKNFKTGMAFVGAGVVFTILLLILA